MILLTGFEPFGGQSTNPSWPAARQAARALRAKGIEAIAVELPCVFGESQAALYAAVDEYEPDVVLCVGQASGRSAVSLERVAINCDDARIADNRGNSPVDSPVVNGGPTAYFSSLPIKAALGSVKQAGIAVEISQTAGTFVCNHIFYSLMHLLAARDGVRGGFIHIPSDPGHVAAGSTVPTMTVDMASDALVIIALTTLGTTVDVRISAGATH
ncbi:pyroglutamyl-peptidase I [Pseudarthrobacter sp. PS3-L1]|uniref:pyroglutamyl-peptidase I n=1 Tax=Pseudarthrobacter sp. PS3-L1 TaxID=3046207 RepID=UPI0024BAFF1F|nr:pyroglutamyl-peptidase I [Pseudarthrobacter sp. PS3-L1]MDJ0321923.1 pyroglutamyl-peptidase I [Pseudarthrobacter sp. PS3-L1]